MKKSKTNALEVDGVFHIRIRIEDVWKALHVSNFLLPLRRQLGPLRLMDVSFEPWLPEL